MWASELKEKALSLGWDDVGITTPTLRPEDAMALIDWIQAGLHAGLRYMENPLRTDPLALFPQAKSVVIFISNYKQPHLPFKPDKGLIASYARGRDYHHLHRKRLKKMIEWIEEKGGEARGFSDAFPLMEKAFAVQAGLGWFGKNTLVIHRKFGTFFLLSGVLTTLSFTEQVLAPRLPRCGICTRCLDACPTQALIAPYRLDASKCLAFHTIESSEALPSAIRKKNPGYAFGCDVCQDVCPHNVRSPLSQESHFGADQGIGPYLSLETLQATPAEALFGTPLQRRGKEGLRHTLNHLSKIKP